MQLVDTLDRISVRCGLFQQQETDRRGLGPGRRIVRAGLICRCAVAIACNQETIIFNGNNVLSRIACYMQSGALDVERNAAAPLRGYEQAEQHNLPRASSDQNLHASADFRDPASYPVPGKEKMTIGPRFQIAPESFERRLLDRGPDFKFQGKDGHIKIHEKMFSVDILLDIAKF